MENATPTNVLRDKSYKFALRNISLYKYLIAEKNEFVLWLQKILTASIKTAKASLNRGG